MNVDFSGIEFQLHRIHMPGSLDSEDAPIQFEILHPGIVACRVVNTLQTRNSQDYTARGGLNGRGVMPRLRMEGVE